MRHLILVPMLCASLSWASYAADQAAEKNTPPTPEQRAEMEANREKMAAMHEKMAACLKSNRPVEECHEEMHKEGHHCPMKGKGHAMKGPKSGKDKKSE